MTTRTVLWIIALCTAVAATSRYTDPVVDKALITEAAGDSYSYLAIAEAAPALPTATLPFHHSQRLVVPYLIGLGARITHFPVHGLFQIAVLLTEVAILLVVAGILDRFAIRTNDAVLLLGMIALNPWAFRHYLTFPEMINDLGFVLGLSVLVRGLVLGRVSNVMVGQLVASVCRQNGLLLVPLVALWVWRDAKTWAQQSARRRVGLIMIVGAVAGLIYSGTGYAAASFAGASDNAEHVLGLGEWLLHDFDASLLGLVMLKMLAGVAVPLACLAGMVRVWDVRAPSLHTVLLLLFGSVCCWAQPVLSGPAIMGGNGERYAGFGLIPLVLALGLMIRDAGGIRLLARQTGLLAAILLLAIGSLHHIYTSPALSPFTSRTRFGLAYAVVCVGVFMLAYFGVADRSALHGESRAVA